ncbi:MAG: hypothetical protein LBN39_06280 [Planctomycetaceae bacterium]|jgi:HEAT repeat protein|nr:hypothetical protein [Planctomycetaceae bacterium]
MLKHFFITLIVLSALPLSAQDPDWHVVPKDDLLGNRGPIAKELLATTDEGKMLQIWQRPETDEGILYLKMLAAKRLGTHGTKAAVPVLIPKLDSPIEGFYARYALETIPGDEVDEALAKAAAGVKPETLAGILTTLGVRANPKSAAAAKNFLKNENKDVRKAAGYAYAKTAGDEAIEFFTQKSIDPVLADSGFLLAEEYAAKGNKETAIKIYDALAAADIENYKKEAAVFWGILIRGNAGIDLLVKQLNSESPKYYAVGLKAARELSGGADVTKALIAQLDKQVDPFRKSLLVRAIGGRTDKDSIAVSLPVIETLTKSGDDKVQVAAVDSLRYVGGPSSLPVLLTAVKGSEKVAAAAKNTLENLSGKEIDDAIVKLLSSSDAATKITAINLISERRIKTGALQKELGNADAGVRKAALDAMGQTATLGDLPMLLKVLDKADSDEEADSIVEILKSACTRMPQNEASAEVAKQIASSSDEVKGNLLDLLREIGGAKAMEITEQYAWGNNAALKDKATQNIGSWRSPQDLDLIAKAALKLAKESTDNKYINRGLGGYLRLARQFNMSEERRIQMCNEVFTLAKQDSIKVNVIDVYWRYPSLKTLAEAVKYLDNDKFKDKAAETVVKLAEKLQGKDPAIKAAMEKVIAKSSVQSVKEAAKRVLDKQ